MIFAKYAIMTNGVLVFNVYAFLDLSLETDVSK